MPPCLRGSVRVCVIVLLIAATACSREAAVAPHAVAREHLTMGSLLKVSAWTTDDAAAVETFDHVFREFDRLDAMLTVWKNDSDVSRINAAAGREPVAVSRETIEVLTIAHQVSVDTGGKFDITFGALTDIWKFDHDQDNTVPDRSAIEARLPLINYEEVAVDRSAGTAFIRKPGMRIHLGGIGKGYAVDRAAGVLRGLGITSALVSAGGSTLYAIGHPPGQDGWKVAIQDPSRRADALAVVSLHDNAVSTSGVSERFVVENGHRYAHIIDPRSGEPSEGMCQVTLIAPDATASDALTKAAFLLTRRQLIDRFDARPGIHVLRVEDTCAGPIWTTPWSAGVFAR